MKRSENHKKLTVTLIITTYNSVAALETVLVSVMRQSVLPEEVIIADDGSAKDTWDLICCYQKNFPVPLIHAWQEDKGFRLARARNQALAKSASAYIIMIDGDMVLHPLFVSDHKKYAQKGIFIQGSRVMFTREKTQAYLAAAPSLHQSVRWYDRGVGHKWIKRFYACRMPLLTKLFKRKRRYNQKIKGCNISFFLSDALQVNGFNNDFVGWGREDNEFVTRLYHIGVRLVFIKFSCIAYHLWHREAPRAALAQNEALLREAIENKAPFCKNGLEQIKNNKEETCPSD